MDLLQTIQEKPVLSIGGAFSVLASVVGAVIWLWGEFAHAGDVRQEIDAVRIESRNAQAATIREVQVNRLSGEIGLLDIQIRDSRNRMLDSKDATTRQRYAGDLDQLERDRTVKSRTLEQIKAGVAVQ